MGSLGTALWDGINKPSYETIRFIEKDEFVKECVNTSYETSWNGKEGHYGCLDEMFSAIINDRKAETNCSDNIKSMAMVSSAIESAKKNKKIFIDY